MPNWCDNELTIQGKSGVLASQEQLRATLRKGRPVVLIFKESY